MTGQQRRAILEQVRAAQDPRSAPGLAFVLVRLCHIIVAVSNTLRALAVAQLDRLAGKR